MWVSPPSPNLNHLEWKNPPKKTNRHCPNTSADSRCPETHLMPVENGIVDLFHRAWGQMVNNPERNKNIDFKPINTTVERREGGWGGGAFFQAKWQPRQWRWRKRLQSEPEWFYCESVTHFCCTECCSASYSQRTTPLFNSFWKSAPMERPVMSWIHSLSSSSFWRSYFCAIWGGAERSKIMCHKGGGEGETGKLCGCIHSGHHLRPSREASLGTSRRTTTKPNRNDRLIYG